MTAATSTPRERSTRSTVNAELSGLLKTIEAVIEEERARLMSAEAVLHCAAIAMDDEERGDARKPHYPSVIDVARSLIAKTISQLEDLKPLLERAREHGDHGVKEHGSTYLH